MSPAVTLIARLWHGALFHLMVALTRIFRGAPARWVLWVADRAGDVHYFFNARDRRVGLQNMDVVFGDTLSPKEKRRILRASMRQMARGMAVLFHAAPLTPKSVRRWVDLPAEMEAVIREAAARANGGVVVSGHVGSWEMLIGFALLMRDVGDSAFLVETTTYPAVDRFLDYVRGSGGGRSTMRKGGAQAMSSHVRRGGYAGILIDRNARRNQGGIWSPFFGLEARTTPLPALIARRSDKPVVPIFCLPLSSGRYRMWLAPEPSMEVRTDDLQADVLEITTRLNRILEEVIRAHPEAWNWTLKRFKGRPHEDRGDYPPYSLWDP